MSSTTAKANAEVPAFAEAVVQHATKLCETADHLWRVLGQVSIPTAWLTDHRQQHKATFGTEAVARVYLYQTIYGLSQNEVADHLETRPALLKELGMSQPPTQQNLSYAWKQFTPETKHILDAAAKGIAREAINHGVRLEARVPILSDEDDPTDEEDEQPVSREYVREQGSKLVELARRHGFNEFSSHRVAMFRRLNSWV